MRHSDQDALEIGLGEDGQLAAVLHALLVELDEGSADPVGFRRAGSNAAVIANLIQNLRQQVYIFRKER